MLNSNHRIIFPWIKAGRKRDVPLSRCRIIAAVFLMLAASPLAAVDFEIGPRMGFTHVLGYYGGPYQGTWLVGLSGAPYVARYWRVEVDGTVALHPIKQNLNLRASRLTAVSFAAGVMAGIPVARYFQIDAGLFIDGRYLQQRTGLLGHRLWAVKPGLMAKAGVTVPLAWGVLLRGGIEYTLHELSAKPFHGLSYTAGISFGYANYRETKSSRESRRQIDLTAEQLSTRNRAQMEQARTEFVQARELIRRGTTTEAITLLEKAAPLLHEAKMELERLRTDLRRELPALEKKGIEAYESKEYEKCIAIMKRIRLIDPENRTAALYLPRALKRFEALQRLR